MFDINDIYKRPSDYKKTKLTKSQQHIHDEISKIIKIFFSAGKYPDFKVNGFLIYGVPQTGKTEIAKQVALTIWKDFRELSICIVDAADLAKPRFGDSEKTIQMIFNPPEYSNKKKIIVFDDIDCLFFGRENITSRSWHISMSSVMFHELDNIDPRLTAFIATSNKKTLMDNAMQSRLLQYELGMPARKELEDVLLKLLKSYNKIDNEQKNVIIDDIKKEIIENQTGFRDIQFMIVRKLAEVM